MKQQQLKAKHLIALDEELAYVEEELAGLRAKLKYNKKAHMPLGNLIQNVKTHEAHVAYLKAKIMYLNNH